MKNSIVFNEIALHYQYSMKISFLSLVLCIILLSNCSKKDPTTDEKVLIETDANKKAREFADKGGGLFGDINNKKSGSTTFEFASSNVLWRATLKSLDFLPLINADYSGGVIIYDWYSQTNNPKEQIKISVQFLNNELRADSIKITAHKKFVIAQTVVLTPLLIKTLQILLKKILLLLLDL